MNLEQLYAARQLASPLVYAKSGADASPAFCIQYVPDLGTGGAAATIALIQNSTMTVLVDAAAPTGADAIGTNGVIVTSAAANDTVGELQATFNAKAAYRFIRLGAIGSDAMSGILAKSASSCIGPNGLFFYFDGSVSKKIGIPFTGERFVDNGINGHQKDADNKNLCSINYFEWVSAVTVTNGTIKVYADDQTTPIGGEDLLFQAASFPTAGTRRKYGDENPSIPWITAPMGKRILVQIYTPSSTTGPVPTAISVHGQVAVSSGAYLVTEFDW
jgi:hypothetical protein